MSRVLPWILGLITAVTVVAIFDSTEEAELTALKGERIQEEPPGPSAPDSDQPTMNSTSPSRSAIAATSETSSGYVLPPRPQIQETPMELAVLRQQMVEMSPEDPFRPVRERMLRLMEDQVTYLTGSGVSPTDAERIVNTVVVEIAACRDSFSTQSEDRAVALRELSADIAICRDAAYQRAGLLGYEPPPWDELRPN